MTWFYLTIASIILYTSVGLLQRVLSIDSKNHRAMGFVFGTYAGLSALIIFFLTSPNKHITLPTTVLPYILLGIACIGYAIFDRLRFKVSNMMDASTFATVSTTAVLVAFIISAILYKEVITIQKILGFLLILIALILISYQPNTKKTAKGIGLGIFIFTVVGIVWALDKMGTLYFNADTYNIGVWVLPIILIYFPYIKPKDIKLEIKMGSWKLMLLAAMNALAYFLQLKAVTLSEATKVIPLVQTYVIATVLFGIIFLKERDNIGKKIIASILGVFGAILLI